MTMPRKPCKSLDPNQLLYSFKETMEILGVGRERLDTWVKDGSIVAVDFSSKGFRELRFHYDDINNFFAAKRTKPTQKRQRTRQQKEILEFDEFSTGKYKPKRKRG